MRCRYCDGVMEGHEYAWSAEQREFVEGGRHKNGRCVGGALSELDLDDFEDLPTVGESDHGSGED